MNELEFIVDYPPTPWKRPGGTTQRFDSQVAEKQAFCLVVLHCLKGQVPYVSVKPYFSQNVPLSVSLVFYCKKPVSSKLEYPTNKSDIDNLTKFVLDALQSGPLKGKIWQDDGQVVELHAQKRWADCDNIYCLVKELV